MSRINPSEMSNKTLAFVLDEYVDLLHHLPPHITLFAQEAAFRLRKCPIPFQEMYTATE